MLEKTTDSLLVIFGSKDIYMKPSPETAAKLMKEKAKSAKSVTVKLIKGATHSYLGYEKQLVEIILNWIKKYYLDYLPQEKL